MKRFDNAEMLSVLKGAESVFLCTHVRPDGDAIGSLLALGAALSSMGKRVTMACEDDVPIAYQCLPGAERIVRPENVRETFDLALAVDAADEKRIGACGEIFFHTAKTAQIDHHPTNTRFALVNEVDGEAGAAALIVLRLIKALGVIVTPDMAACLYGAISSDTGNFCFAGADAEVFDAMAELSRAGLDIAQYAQKLHLTRQREHVLLLGRALCSLRFFADGRAAGMRITRSDFIACGASNEHADKIVNYALYIPGVEMAYLATEGEKCDVKFSLRAKSPNNVSAIAARFGGGGHVLASGCSMDLPLDEAVLAIESAYIEALQG